MQDEILQSLMYDLEPAQARASRSDALSANDSTSTSFSTDSFEMPVGGVRGGTISFIFERFSATIEKENDSEPGDGGTS